MKQLDLSGFIKLISIVRNSSFLNNCLYKLYMAEGSLEIIHDILFILLALFI